MKVVLASKRVACIDLSFDAVALIVTYNLACKEKTLNGCILSASI